MPSLENPWILPAVVSTTKLSGEAEMPLLVSVAASTRDSIEGNTVDAAVPPTTAAAVFIQPRRAIFPEGLCFICTSLESRRDVDPAVFAVAFELRLDNLKLTQSIGELRILRRHLRILD